MLSKLVDEALAITCAQTVAYREEEPPRPPQPPTKPDLVPASPAGMRKWRARLFAERGRAIWLNGRYGLTGHAREVDLGGSSESATKGMRAQVSDGGHRINHARRSPVNARLLRTTNPFRNALQ
jgi:hypothetical protein